MLYIAVMVLFVPHGWAAPGHSGDHGVLAAAAAAAPGFCAALHVSHMFAHSFACRRWMRRGRGTRRSR